MFPYNSHTFDNFEHLNLKGVITEAGSNEIGIKFDTETFISSIDNILGCRIDDEHFDMVEYVEFYNIQDGKYSFPPAKKNNRSFPKVFWWRGFKVQWQLIIILILLYIYFIPTFRISIFINGCFVFIVSLCFKNEYAG